MIITELLTVTTITLLAVMSPGPDFAIVSRNSLKYSRNAGYATALGIALGLTIHITYSLIGIGLIISRSILLFNILKYLGAAYIIYIGILSLRAKPNTATYEDTDSHADISLTRAVRMGFLTNALNPKATLFFLALFTQIISPTTAIGVKFLFGAEIMLISLAWFSLLSYLLTIGGVKNVIKGIQHHIERGMGVILLALGIKVAFFTHR